MRTVSWQESGYVRVSDGDSLSVDASVDMKEALPGISVGDGGEGVCYGDKIAGVVRGNVDVHGRLVFLSLLVRRCLRRPLLSKG